MVREVPRCVSSVVSIALPSSVVESARISADTPPRPPAAEQDGILFREKHYMTSRAFSVTHAYMSVISEVRGRGGWVTWHGSLSLLLPPTLK